MKKILAITLVVLGMSVISLPASAYGVYGYGGYGYGYGVYDDCCSCNYVPVVSWGCDYCY